MPNYMITSPDGKKFKITAPEGATQDQVLSYAKAHWTSLGGTEPHVPPTPSAPAPSDISSIGAGLGRGFGESMLGAQQLLGKVLTQPTLPAAPNLNSLISGQPQESTTGVSGFLNKITNVENMPGEWLQKNAAQGLSNLQKQEAPYQAAHPNLAGAGEMGGKAAAMIAPESLAGKAAPAATWLSRLGQAAKSGGIAGAEQPISGPDYWKQKAEETAANIAGSIAFGQLGEGVRGISRIVSKYMPSAAKSHAMQKVISTIKEQEDAGYVKAQDIIDLHNTYHAAGVPATLMETGGDLIQGLAGSVGRTPGTAQAIIKGSFKSRMAGLRDAMLTSIKRNFDSPKTKLQTQESLDESQWSASRPLYQKAFQPSSISSIAKQFKKPFDDIAMEIKTAQKESDAAEKRFSDARDVVSRGKSHVYLNTPELQAMNGAQADAESAANKLKALQQQKESIKDQLRVAQQAEAKGIRGAVWSPHIARMLTNPRIISGIKHGLGIQRDEADAKFAPFDPNDYGVKINAHGEPEIFGTPNMRLLDAAKKGLDAMVAAERDSETGKLSEEGVAINKLRRAWIDELDRINPHYKPARDAYAGFATLKNAMELGSKIMKTDPEYVKKWFDELSESEKEHFRIGAAHAYSKHVSDSELTDREFKQISKMDELASARKRLEPIFKTKAQLNDFMDSVTGWKAISNAWTEIMGGPKTAERLEASADHNSNPALGIASSALQAKAGHITPALNRISKYVSRLDPTKSKAVNAEIARILTNKDIKFSQIPGQILDMPTTPPPGKFTSATLASSPIGQALGAQAGSWFENQVSGQ